MAFALGDKRDHLQRDAMGYNRSVVMIQPEGCGVNNQPVKNLPFSYTGVANCCGVGTNAIMTFSEKVTKRLREIGWNKSDLARAIGKKQQSVSRWLNKDKPPRVENVVLIASAINLPVGYLADNKMDVVPEGDESKTSEFWEVVKTLVEELGLKPKDVTARLMHDLGAKQVEVSAKQDVFPRKPPTPKPKAKGH